MTGHEDMKEILSTLLTEASYPVSNLKRVFEEMHAVLGMPKLSKVAQSRPLMFSRIPPDARLVNKDQTVHALTRALKMMLYSNSK